MRRIVMAIGGVGVITWWWLADPMGTIEGKRASGLVESGRETSPDRESQAEQAFYRGDYEPAIALYRSIVHEDPENGLAWARLAYSMHELQKFEAALELHERAATFEENRATSHFKLGCALARLGREAEAFDALEKAVEYGYRDRSRTEHEADLESLRGEPGFARVLNRMAPPREGESPLDYWTGFWILRDSETGEPIGHTTLQRAEGGHVYLEQWSEYTGSSGRGLLYLDPRENAWVLHRVTSQGEIHRLKGTLENDGQLHLTGDRILHSGRTEQAALRFEPRPNGAGSFNFRVREEGAEDWEVIAERRLNRDDSMWLGRRR